MMCNAQMDISEVRRAALRRLIANRYEGGVVAAAWSMGSARDDPPEMTAATHVKCPDCAELVRREAKVCKHCGCRLVPQ